MKNEIYKHLKFKIGEGSYDREFDIIPIPPFEIIENGLSLEPYEYFGEIDDILGFKPSQIILYYNADILMRVKVFYRGDITKQLIHKLESLKVNLPKELTLQLSFDYEGNLTLLLHQNKILTKNTN